MTLQNIRATQSEWVSTYVLAAGEVGVETDTHKIKVGDGTTTWASLPYVGGAATISLDDLSDVALSSTINHMDILVYDGETSSWNASAANNAGIATIQQASPTGAVTMYAGIYAPSGWLLCDGSTFSSTTYPNLATVLGDYYGTHSGTTYYLPDMRGRVAVGPDAMGGTSANRNPTYNLLGQWRGEALISITTANLPQHTHGGTTNNNDASHTHTYSGDTIGETHLHTVPNNRVVSSTATNGPLFESWPGGTGTTRTHNTSAPSLALGYSGTTAAETQTHKHTFTTDTGTGLSASPTQLDNRQPYLVLSYIIKT